MTQSDCKNLQSPSCGVMNTTLLAAEFILGIEVQAARKTRNESNNFVMLQL